MFEMLNPYKEKWQALFVLKTADTYTVVGKKKLNPTKTEVSFRNHTFTIDYTKVIMRNKNTNILVFEVGKMQLSGFNHQKQEVSSEIIDSIISKSIIRQLVGAFNPRALKVPIGFTIVCIIMGIMVGYVLGYVIPIDEIQKSVAHLMGR